MSKILVNFGVVNKGMRFGRLVVLGRSFFAYGRDKEKVRRQFCVCRCDCGTVKISGCGLLMRKTNPVTNCGCVRVEKQKHKGMPIRQVPRLYRIFNGMKQRCHDKNYDAFKWYGARGIFVCDSWRNNFLEFHTWALANGYSDELEIDRIDNDAGYSPDNCRWVTRSVNLRNRRISRMITAFGETKCLADWVDDGRCIVKRRTLMERLRRKWRPEDAITRELEHQGK